jgi:hypothetical protein
MFRQLLPAFLLMAFSAVSVTALPKLGAAGDRLAVIFPPGVTLAWGIKRIAAAGGTAIGAGAFDNVIIAIPHRHDFPDRARAEGAVLILAANGFTGCLGNPGT